MVFNYNKNEFIVLKVFEWMNIKVEVVKLPDKPIITRIKGGLLTELDSFRLRELLMEANRYIRNLEVLDAMDK